MTERGRKKNRRQARVEKARASCLIDNYQLTKAGVKADGKRKGKGKREKDRQKKLD